MERNVMDTMSRMFECFDRKIGNVQGQEILEGNTEDHIW